MISQLVRRYSDSLRWRAALWKAARRTEPVIDQLSQMRAAHPGRPLCGILLVEHIGDIIACEPVIRQMRVEHPDAFIVWVTKPEYATLVAGHPNLDAVVCVDSLLDIWAISKRSVFDVLIDLHVNEKPTGVEGLDYAKRSGDPRVNAANYFQHGSLLRSMSTGAGLQPLTEAARIYVPAETVAAIDRLNLPERFVAIHTTSTFDLKDWPAEKWRELIRHILDHYDTHVIEVGLRSSIDVDDSQFASLCGKLSLLETAELLRRSSFFIGVDSAPAHMANVWARPALLLFGKYPSTDFNPFEGYYAMHAASVMLRSSGLVRELTTETVVSALEASELWQSAYGVAKRGALRDTSLQQQGTR